MRSRLYLKQLARDLPGWVEKGWVAPGGDQAILDDLRSGLRTGNIAPLAFGILGAVALGAGIVTFFAANWQEIPKIAKLGLLLAALWGCFAGAALCLRRDASPMIGQAVLLLAVLVFGANIELIGQAYHIGNHYPDGLLLWALGALALTALVPSEPVAVLGFVLTGLWSTAETIGFWGSVHWPFLILWAAFMAPTLARRWVVARHMGFLAALYWCGISLVNLHPGESLFLEIVYVPAAMTIGLLGAEIGSRGAETGATMRSYSLILGLFALYGLGFRLYQAIGRIREPHWLWIGIFALACIAVIGLAVFRSSRRRARFNAVDWTAAGLAGLIFLALLSTLFDWGGLNIRAAVFRVLLFAGALWTVAYGYQRERRSIVNIGFAFFALGIATVYVDTLWSYMNRSLALTGGGVLLLVGGYVLERQRRRLLKDWTASS